MSEAIVMEVGIEYRVTTEMGEVQAGRRTNHSHIIRQFCQE